MMTNIKYSFNEKNHRCINKNAPNLRVFYVTDYDKMFGYVRYEPLLRSTVTEIETNYNSIRIAAEVQRHQEKTFCSK